MWTVVHTKSLLTQQFQSEAWDLIFTLLHMHYTYFSIDLSLSFDFIFWLLIFLWIVFKTSISKIFSFLYSLFLQNEISLSPSPNLSLSLVTRSYFVTLLFYCWCFVLLQKCQFEHRDLHWGNVLIMETDTKLVEFTHDGKTYVLRSHGVLATVIDFTFSRIETCKYM